MALELSAELQAALPQAVTEAAQRMHTARTLKRQLAHLGISRRAVQPSGPCCVTAISVQSRLKRCSAGWLFGVVGVAASISFGTTEPRIWSTPLTRCGLFSGGEPFQRLKWKKTVVAYELLGELLRGPKLPDALLIDGGLLLSRAYMPTVMAEADEDDDWAELRKKADGFWAEAARLCKPFNLDGPFILGLSESQMAPLFSALAQDRTYQVTSDPLPGTTHQWLRDNHSALRSVGTLPLLEALLGEGVRSVGFSYALLDLDERLEPSRLVTSLGVTGFAVGLGQRVWQVELPGTAPEWSSDSLDYLAGVLTHSCIGRKRDPLPLWYARARSVFPEALLDHFERSLRSELRRLEEATP